MNLNRGRLNRVSKCWNATKIFQEKESCFIFIFFQWLFLFFDIKKNIYIIIIKYSDGENCNTQYACIGYSSPFG